MESRRWAADHCIDSTKVPAVLFANRDISHMPGLSFRYIPFLALGKHLDQSYIKPPVSNRRAGSEGYGIITEYRGYFLLCSRIASAISLKSSSNATPRRESRSYLFGPPDYTLVSLLKNKMNGSRSADWFW